MRSIYKYLLLFSVVLVFNKCTKDSAGGGTESTGAGGSTARFTIAGNYLYVVDNTSLKAFDISNTAISPVLKSTTDIGINIETIFPYQDKLFIGSSTSMYIYSLSNPERPSLLARAQYLIRMACDPVVAKDSTAYATLNASGRCAFGRSALVIYDIRDPNRPVLKGDMPLSDPFGLGISDNALYVCEGLMGLRVYDINNTYAPRLITTIVNGDTFYDVIPYGNILICQVKTGILLYDISNRHQPVLLSRILN